MSAVSEKLPTEHLLIDSATALYFDVYLSLFIVCIYYWTIQFDNVAILILDGNCARPSLPFYPSFPLICIVFCVVMFEHLVLSVLTCS